MKDLLVQTSDATQPTKTQVVRCINEYDETISKIQTSIKALHVSILFKLINVFLKYEYQTLHLSILSN